MSSASSTESIDNGNDDHPSIGEEPPKRQPTRQLQPPSATPLLHRQLSPEPAMKRNMEWPENRGSWFRSREKYLNPSFGKQSPEKQPSQQKQETSAASPLLCLPPLTPAKIQRTTAHYVHSHPTFIPTQRPAPSAQYLHHALFPNQPFGRNGRQNKEANPFQRRLAPPPAFSKSEVDAGLRTKNLEKWFMDREEFLINQAKDRARRELQALVEENHVFQNNQPNKHYLAKPEVIKSSEPLCFLNNEGTITYFADYHHIDRELPAIKERNRLLPLYQCTLEL